MNVKDNFNLFLRLLIEAAARIETHYFQLPVAGAEKPMFRERVYCYELYHQLRCVLGDGFPYKLDGEVDKAGHPILPPTLGHKKPDFIVHVPGQMNRNLVVIEVKPVTAPIGRIRDDLRTLQNFLLEGKYYRAIMLLYGNGEYDLPERLRIETDRWYQQCAERVLFMWHRGPTERPEIEPISPRINPPHVTMGSRCPACLL